MEKENLIKVKNGKWYSDDKSTQEYMEKVNKESELKYLKKYYPKQYEEIMTKEKVDQCLNYSEK